MRTELRETIGDLIPADNVLEIGRKILSGEQVDEAQIATSALQFILRSSLENKAELKYITDRMGSVETLHKRVENMRRNAGEALDDTQDEVAEWLIMANEYETKANGYDAIRHSCMVDNNWLPLLSYAHRASRQPELEFLRNHEAVQAKRAFWDRVAAVVLVFAVGPEDQELIK